MEEAKKDSRLKYKNKKPSDFTTFHEKIACARINFYNGRYKKKGLSLEEAAAAIGDISFGYLGRLENDKRQCPNAILVRRLEIFYKFQPGELADILAAREGEAS